MALATPLLSTKLFVPPSDPRHVQRPRLEARLDAGLQARLMVVSAPAGFGKTTLLAGWVGGLTSKAGGRRDPSGSLQPSHVQPSTRVAWVSLDEGDNDVARFLAYVSAALATVTPGIEVKLSGVSDTPHVSQVEAFLNSLINALAADQEPIVLVLDDYHAIETQGIHAALDYLIDHMPACLHLILATRAEPPLHLARWRARGQLIEIRQDDLRFTSDEAARFLKQSKGLDLTEDQFAALAARTEGWIAGLQMASLAIQPAFTSRDRQGITDFIQGFTGSSHFILDYLLEEVLSRQPEAIQEFLLKTSILDRFTASLCDAVIGDEGQGMRDLAYLEHTNLFVLPLDHQRRWYRYHHLFAEALHQRLEATRPGEAAQLHRRASRWFEANELLPEAIRHALAAQDYERAAELVEAAAETTLAHSEMTTFSSWVASLPDDLVRARPYLCIYHAFALFSSSGSREEIEARLKDAQSADADETVLDLVRAFSSLLAGFRDGLESPFKPSQALLDGLPEKSRFLRSLAAVFLSETHILSEDLPTAIQELERAARISQEAGNWMGYLTLHSQIAGFYVVQGKLHAADAKYREVLEFVDDDSANPLPVVGLAYIGKGDLLREWNELDAAMQHLDKGAELVLGSEKINTLYAYIALAKARQAQGDAQAARDSIRMAVQTALQLDISTMDDRYVSIHQARLWIAQGDLGTALEWARTRGLDEGFHPEELEGQKGRPFLSIYLRGLELTTLARLHLALGRPVQAQHILAPLLPFLEKQGFIGLVIEALTLQSLAYRAQSDGACALEALERALELAEPEGYLRLFLDEGEPMRSLIVECRAQIAGRDGGASDPILARLNIYMERLLAAFPLTETQPARPQILAQPSGISNPLTDRELEVLQKIAAGLSNQEIADQMILALSTVKSHVHHIYRKLGATNRTLAVARARQLSLL